MFGPKTPENKDLIRLIGSEVAGQPTKAELKELARCEEAVTLAVGDEKPLVLLVDPGVGVTAVTDAGVAAVDKSGELLSFPYADIVETKILMEVNDGVAVSFESRRARDEFTLTDPDRFQHMIRAGVPSLEIAQRVCSTVDPKLGASSSGSVKKKRKKG